MGKYHGNRTFATIVVGFAVENGQLPREWLISAIEEVNQYVCFCRIHSKAVFRREPWCRSSAEITIWPLTEKRTSDLRIELIHKDTRKLYRSEY